MIGEPDKLNSLRSGVHRNRRPIAVFEYDASTSDVLKAALLSGFQPIAVFAPSLESQGTSEIVIHARELSAMAGSTGGQAEALKVPVTGDEAFKRTVAENGALVVLGVYNHHERDSFREALLQARHQQKLEGLLLHPAFLCDYHKNSNRRTAIIGFPGSGNMIFQNICWKLSPAPPVPIWAKDPLSAAVSQFAITYWYSVSGHIAAAFDDAGRWQDISSPTHMRYGAIYLGLRDQISPALITGLPQRSYVWSNPWHLSHEPLTKRTYEFLSGQNFQIIQLLRHPLDLVVSNAAKITAASRDRAPQVLLQNDEWMDSILQAIEAYYACIAEHLNAPGVSFLRYEELLAAPGPAVRKLAEILGIRCNDRAAENIWASLEGKPLSGGGHLWDPRAGKWQEYIPPRFAERIRKSRLRKYAEAAGYRLEAEDFRGTRAALPSHECDLLNMAWQDARWEAPTGKRHAVHHPGLHRVHDKDRGLLYVCGREFAEPMKRLQKSPLLRDLVAAASDTPWTEASLLADYLNLR